MDMYGDVGEKNMSLWIYSHWNSFILDFLHMMESWLPKTPGKQEAY